MDPRDERQIARLRAEIQRAGAITSLLRGGLQVGAWVARGLAFLFLGLMLVGGTAGLSIIGPLLAIAGSLVVLLATGAALAVPAAAAFRRLRREQLRRELARLDRDQLAGVLLPLKECSFPDTRAIVEPLVREFRPEGTEVAPSLPPEGGEHEVTPAG